MQTAEGYAQAAERSLQLADDEFGGDARMSDAYRADALVFATLAVAAATNAQR